MLPTVVPWDLGCTNIGHVMTYYVMSCYVMRYSTFGIVLSCTHCYPIYVQYDGTGWTVDLTVLKCSAFGI